MKIMFSPFFSQTYIDLKLHGCQFRFFSTEMAGIFWFGQWFELKYYPENFRPTFQSVSVDFGQFGPFRSILAENFMRLKNKK